MISNNPNFGIYTGIAEYQIIINSNGGVSYIKNDYFDIIVSVAEGEMIVTIKAKQRIKIAFSPKSINEYLSIQTNPYIVKDTDPTFSIQGDACDLTLFRYLDTNWGLQLQGLTATNYTWYIEIDQA